MDFSLSEEQTLLKDSVSKYLTENYDFKHRQKLANSRDGFSSDHWLKYAEFGWLGLPFDTEIGGYGGRIEDTVIICEELGKHLVLEPFLANVVLAGSLLSEGGVSSSVAAIIDGSTQFAFAGFERNGRQNVYQVETTAIKTDDYFVLNGEKVLVLNGMNAEFFIVSARTSGKSGDKKGISLFLVNANQATVSRSEIIMMDGARVANIKLENTVVELNQMIGVTGGAERLLEKLVKEARIAIAAESVGIIDTLQKKTVEYAKTREQFGVSIGSFQALQHRMVDLYIAAEQARSILYRAICEYQQGEKSSGSTILGMKALVGQKARLVGEEAIQLHGGMGMTDELDIGHYVKRLMVLTHLFGDIDATFKELAEEKFG